MFNPAMRETPNFQLLAALRSTLDVGCSTINGFPRQVGIYTFCAQVRLAPADVFAGISDTKILKPEH